MTEINSFWFREIRGSFPLNENHQKVRVETSLIGWRKYNWEWFPNLVSTNNNKVQLDIVGYWQFVRQNPVHPLLWQILFLACTYPWGPLPANTLSINYPGGEEEDSLLKQIVHFPFSQNFPCFTIWCLPSFLINITTTQQFHHHSIVSLDEQHIYNESTPLEIFLLSLTS